MKMLAVIKLCGALLLVGISSLISIANGFEKTSFATVTPPAAPAVEEANFSESSVNEISLLSPAPFSQVLSPIPIEAEVRLHHAKTIRLDLLDASGEILSRKVYSLRVCNIQEEATTAPLLLDIPLAACFQPQAGIKTSLNFLMDQASQKGYLQVGIADEKHRMRSLETVELQLLSQGKQVLLSTASSNHSLKILTPAGGAEISGGKLFVQGEASQLSSLPLRVFLTTDDGQVVGSRMARIDQQSSLSSNGQPNGGTFSLEVPYRIKQSKAALLSVTLNSEAFKGPFLLTSQEVYLTP